MDRNRTNRAGAALSEQKKKPVPQVERANSSDRQILSEELSSFQTALVSVNFNRKPILVSRRSLSEIARSQEPTIIYIEENEHDARKILVIFNPTTKTYKILSFQFSKSTRTNSSIEIEPSTEEGRAWVQCLQQAYPYYDFENGEILNKYYYENLLDSLPILLPKVIEHKDYQLSAFSQPETVSLWYSRISYEELEKSFPRLSWFDPYSYTHYILLFDPNSQKYIFIFRYRKVRFLYTVTIEIQEINEKIEYVRFSKKIAKKCAQAPKPRGPLKPKTSSSKEDSNAQPQPENQLPKPTYDHLVSTITTALKNKFSSTEILESFVKATIAEMIQKLPAAKLADLNSLNQDFCEKFIEDNTRAIVTKILPHNNLNPEETRPVLTEGKHPELIALINLLHSVYPDYDFDLGKVKDKK